MLAAEVALSFVSILILSTLWFWWRSRYQNYEQRVKTLEADLERAHRLSSDLVDQNNHALGEWRSRLSESETLLKKSEEEIQDLKQEVQSLNSEVRKQRGRAQSAHTTRGQLLEKWAPFVEAEGIEEHWKPEDWCFMGQPIDYIVFDWKSDQQKNLEEGQVILLDVKSGKASLTTKQRRIRDLVQAGKVVWREVRLE